MTRSRPSRHCWYSANASRSLAIDRRIDLRAVLSAVWVARSFWHCRSEVEISSSARCDQSIFNVQAQVM